MSTIEELKKIIHDHLIASRAVHMRVEDLLEAIELQIQNYMDLDRPEKRGTKN